MKRITAAAMCAFSMTLLAAPDALGRNVLVSGHVLAPPTASGRLVSVPALLQRGAERRLHAGTPVVRLLIGRRRVSAPRAFATGRERVRPTSLRPGDRFVARIVLRASALRRARTQPVPSLRARGLRVTARASALSAEELTRLIQSLQAQLTALSARLDELAARQASDFAALSGELAALAARVAALESGLAALQALVTGLDAKLLERIEELELDMLGLCGAVPLACS